MGGFRNGCSCILNQYPFNRKQKRSRRLHCSLQKVDALFGQLVDNLKLREEKNIIPPKFVFPYVINDCKNVITGAPFEKGKPASTLLEDFTTKTNKLSDVDDATKKELIKKAEKHQ